MHVRKAISNISAQEVEDIVDDKVRERVLDKLRELGGGDPKKRFAHTDNHPFLEAGFIDQMRQSPGLEFLEVSAEIGAVVEAFIVDE